MEKIINHADNRALRSGGREDGILHPGDELTIPDLTTKQVDGATDQRHRFRCSNQSAWLKVRFLENDEPRSNVSYLLQIGAQEFRGNLDDDGWLEVRVPGDAQQAVLLLGEEGQEERIELNIGHLNPPDEISGAKQRLNNLGFHCGEENEELDDITRQALRSFQLKQDLEETGELDDETRSRLTEIHDA